MAAQALWTRFIRVRSEASWNAATPGGGAGWNIGGNGGGANGWFELPVIKDSDGLQPKSTIIYPTTMAGTRAMNVALPVAGAYPTELGNLEFGFYPELVDRILRAVFGTVQRTESAGTAAKSSVAFASLATLDAQPTGDEQLKFVVASSTAASSAAINILEAGVVVETITIGTSVATVDGSYYSKGGWGAGGTVTFTVTGTVSSGAVVVSGIKYVTNVHTIGNTTPSLVIEQGGRTEAGSGNSEFFPGCVIPTLVLSYDRSAPDNMLMCNATIQGLNPTNATAGTFANDAAKFYQPFAGWTASATIGGAACGEIVAAQITIQPNTSLYAASCGTQQPSGKLEGEVEVFGTFTILPADNTQWNNYRNSTVKDVEIDFLTPFMVNASSPYRLLLELTQTTFSDYTRNRQQTNAQGAEVAFRTIYDSSDGPIKATTRCRLPV
jgi:hypothetical protein